MGKTGRSWSRPFTSCFRSHSQTETKKSITTNTNGQDFYSFEAGRWLWDEKKQLDKRYRKFDVAALQRIAISSVGAKSCVSMTKISELGGNKVFKLVMNNGKTVIAKIPNHRASSGSLRVASEVATMDFASTILGIPVPRVLAWDAREDCPVKSEYILMEEARGTLLDATWETIHPDSKAEILYQLVSVAKQFQSVSFTSIGNIYFAADNVPGSTPAVVNGSLSPKLKAKIQQRYSIGPSVTSSYWEGDRAKIANVHGPWNDPKEWLKAIATREITWLEKYAPEERKQLPLLPAPRGTRQEHVDLWKKFEVATDFVTSINPELVRPTLWHMDLCTSNIFVQKNKITAVIDWEGSGTLPLMFAAQRPALLMPPPDVLHEMPNPEQFASLPDGPEKTRMAKSFEWKYLRYAYDTALLRTNPVFEQLEQIPILLTLQQLILQSNETWTTGAMAFRDYLLTLQTHWHELCPDTPCPYSFTESQLEKHAAEQELFGQFFMLVVVTRSLLKGDGFVEREYFEDVLGLFASIRENAYETLDGDIRDEVVGALAWAVRK